MVRGTRRSVLGRGVVVGLGVVALVVVAPLVVGAQTVFRNPAFAYVVDLPAGWEPVDVEQASFVSFADPQRMAVFQVIAFEGTRFVTAEEIARYIKTSFRATGDAAPYDFEGHAALFADYRFDVGSFAVRGYMTFINTQRYDVAVMTYVGEEYYERYHDLLLSVLDGFALEGEVPVPGPVSQFYADGLEERVAGMGGDSTGRTRGDGTLEGGAAALVLPGGTTYRLPETITDAGLQEAHRVVIEREARVLSAYDPAGEEQLTGVDGEPVPLWVAAWRRYFRILYRDSYTRLTPVAEALTRDLVVAGVPRSQMPARILSWLQGATYRRTGSLSDLMSPAACLATFSGDCDSLGLTYAILLHHLGFDAILMVSVEYSHAMVGVGVAGEGARFPFEGNRWLVAELTDEVPIGRIAAEMSGVEGWIGVNLDPVREW